MMKRIIMLLLACCLLVGAAAAAGGAGTAANPYIIETPVELQSIQNNLAAHYKIANNIDLSGVTWTPIGSESAPFTGSLDGNNHIISNLVLSSSGYYSNGLFKFVAGGATIKNIILKNCKHTSTAANAAILIGNTVATSNPLIISKCHIYSSILINDAGYSGLLLGGAGGDSLVSISDCGIYDSIIIADSQYVGILQGVVASGTHETVSNIIIKNCIISGSTGVGGCFGCIYAYGLDSISSLTASNILVESCTIKASTRAGGIIGFNELTYSEFTLTDSTVKDTSILGSITGGLAT